MDILWITTGAGLLGTLAFMGSAAILAADCALLREELADARAERDALDRENQARARKHVDRIAPLKAANAERAAKAAAGKAA